MYRFLVVIFILLTQQNSIFQCCAGCVCAGRAAAGYNSLRNERLKVGSEAGRKGRGIGQKPKENKSDETTEEGQRGYGKWIGVVVGAGGRPRSNVDGQERFV